MKIMVGLLISAVLLSSGCAAGNWNRNPLRGLTEKQSDWFDRTGEEFRF